MVAESNTTYDGQLYKKGEEIHDLGSFECKDVRSGNRRDYYGLSTDIHKLPKYENLGTDSSATCFDTGDFYRYHAPTKTWYLA